MFGSFSPDALAAYSEQVIEKRPSVDFAEGDTYDFTRCVRSDGSAYGTGGQCRRGTESAKEKEERIAQLRSASKATKASREHKSSTESREQGIEKIVSSYGRLLGKDHPEYEKNMNAMRETIKTLHDKGTNETAKAVASGNIAAVFSRLKKANADEKAFVKEEVAKARKQAQENNKQTYGADMKSKDPKVAAKAKEEYKYYVDKEVARAKYRAEQEVNEAFSALMAMNRARKG